MNDGSRTSSGATVSNTVTSVNDRPVAATITKSLAEDSSTAITLSGTDVESAPLTYTISTPPAFGVLSGTPPNLTYNPAVNFNGSDEFEFTVSDGTLVSSPGIVSLTVTAINDPHIAAEAIRSTAATHPFSIDLVGTHIDGYPPT